MDWSKTFTVKDEHIKLLKAARVRWEDCEFGAPAIDCKRPYGNSDVYGDMAEILGVPDEPESYPELLKLHQELEIVLQILIDNLSIEVGTYKQNDRYSDDLWRKVG